MNVKFSASKHEYSYYRLVSHPPSATCSILLPPAILQPLTLQLAYRHPAILPLPPSTASNLQLSSRPLATSQSFAVLSSIQNGETEKCKQEQIFPTFYGKSR